MSKTIAIIGEGVVGCSTALQLIRRFPDVKIRIFHDRPFEKTCSFGPAGLFRIDQIENKEYGRKTFEWLEHVYKTESGSETGVKLLSGHIQSDSFERLDAQRKAYADIVYNFRFLDEREKRQLFIEPYRHCIHYSAYAAEGNKYVPFLRRRLVESRRVHFEQRRIVSLDEIAANGFELIINCAGLNGARLANDGDVVWPIRGVVFEVDAPWHKHFNYLDFITFTIPKENTVVIGSVKQENRDDLEITDTDREDILNRYYRLHPAMKGAKILSEWAGLRPARKSIRVEMVKMKQNSNEYTVIHHYGHGGNGFTLGWGTAGKVADMVDEWLNNSNKYSSKL